MSKGRDATNDKASEFTRLIRRCAANLLAFSQISGAAKCCEVHPISSRDEAEEAARCPWTLNGKDEALDDLPNLDAEGGRRLRGGGGALRHGARLHRDPHRVARRHHSLRERTSLRYIHACILASVCGATRLDGATSRGHHHRDPGDHDAATEHDLR